MSLLYWIIISIFDKVSFSWWKEWEYDIYFFILLIAIDNVAFQVFLLRRAFKDRWQSAGQIK